MKKYKSIDFPSSALGHFVSLIRGDEGALFFVGFAPLVALMLEALGFETSVERSGPAMIIMAFLSAAAKARMVTSTQSMLDFIENFHKDIERNIREEVESVREDPECENENKIAENAIAEATDEAIAGTEKAVREIENTAILFRAASTDLFRTEWILGILGTAVWGYGDLISWHLIIADVFATVNDLVQQ